MQVESFCSECSKEFKDGDQVIKAGDLKYCEKCFQCSMCNNPMCPDQYVEKANKRYCLTCYENKAAKKCSKCFKAVMGEGVIYHGSLSHQKCFNCTECGTELPKDGFYEKEKKPYCAKCVLAKFAKKCPVCSELITDEPSVMLELDKSDERKLTHMACFKCSKCGKNLMQASMEYVWENDKIYCFECFKSGDLN